MFHPKQGYFRLPRLGPFLIFIVVVASIGSPVVDGLVGFQTKTKMPFARTHAGAVSDGQDVLVLSGCTGPCNGVMPILRYNTTTDVVSVMNSSIASISGAAVVRHGPDVYVAGGAAIYRYDIEDDVVTNPGGGGCSVLPVPEFGLSGVSDGTHLYFFGGWSSGSAVATIFRYDPSTLELCDIGELPSPRYDTSAIWDGRFAYVFGGFSIDGTLDEIVRFDPQTNQVRTLAASLPFPVENAGAAFDGTLAYLLGGNTQDSSRTRDIIAFSPAAEIAFPAGGLINPTTGVAAAAVGSRIFGFGGGGFSDPSSDIVVYSPAPIHNSMCVTTLCVLTPGAQKLADIETPQSLDGVPLSPTNVTIEAGTLRVDVLGEFVETIVVVARANGTPDSSVFNQELGPLMTSYSPLFAVCPNENCALTLNFGQTGNASSNVKIGELWSARLQVFSGPTKLADIPYLTARLA